MHEAVLKAFVRAVPKVVLVVFEKQSRPQIKPVRREKRS